MTTPRLEIDLDKIYHNARTLVERLAVRGISVTGVTKATLGLPDIAQVLLEAGVSHLGDSRIENIEKMRRAGITATMILIRSPMLSQTKKAVAHADISFNTEIDMIRSLSRAAMDAKVTHGIVLMVELGDLREGIMPDDLMSLVHQTLDCPNIVIRGIGTNLACRSGVSPDTGNMHELSTLADSIEAAFHLKLDVVSGGNSANLNWAFSSDHIGRINDLRLGESILLGREPLHRQPIDGLHTDAMTLVAEVIESKVKPSLPWGQIAQSAFGQNSPATDRGDVCQTILAVGQQDVDPCGVQPPRGIEVLGASSDHLILNSGRDVCPAGTEITMQLNYSALVRAMTSPFVTTVLKPRRESVPLTAEQMTL